MSRPPSGCLLNPVEGSPIAYCGTDSLAVRIGARRLDPVRRRSVRLGDGTRAIRALSWDEVEAVRRPFAALNRYDPSAISGTILKCEDEQYALGPQGKPDYAQREQLYCYAVSEKFYALFKIDEHDEPHVT